MTGCRRESGGLEDLPPGIASTPGVFHDICPRWSPNGSTIAFLRSTTDRKYQLFTVSPDRQRYPSYSKVDLNTGVRYRDWVGNLYVNNLTDKRGVLGGGLGVIPPFAFNYILPRTVGLSVSRTF